MTARETTKVIRSDIVSHDEGEKDSSELRDPDEILNHTCSSGFDDRRTDKEFFKKQTQDY